MSCICTMKIYFLNLNLSAANTNVYIIRQGQCLAVNIFQSGLNLLQSVDFTVRLKVLWSSSGGGWTVLSEEVTDSCYVVKDLPTGASYVFRVGCITKKGAGPFSDASAPIVMATHPEGKNSDVSCCCTCVILMYRCKVVIYTSTVQCIDNYNRVTIFSPVYSVCADTHIPLIQTEALGSKVTGSERPTTQKNFNFLSEINRWDFEVEAEILTGKMICNSSFFHNDQIKNGNVFILLYIYCGFTSVCVKKKQNLFNFVI